jgi:hypothetical protein
MSNNPVPSKRSQRGFFPKLRFPGPGQRQERARPLLRLWFRPTLNFRGGNKPMKNRGFFATDSDKAEAATKYTAEASVASTDVQDTIEQSEGMTSHRLC